MRIYLTIFLFGISIVGHGQGDSLDLWISTIHNRQLKLDMNYFGYTIRLDKEHRNNVLRIISAGQLANKKLIDLVTSEDRGVIAHYLLTHLHNNPNPHHLTFEGHGRFTYNGLDLKSKDDSELAATEENLEKCKKDWLKRVSD
jgi:hypothetical protein